MSQPVNSPVVWRATWVLPTLRDHFVLQHPLLAVGAADDECELALLTGTRLSIVTLGVCVSADVSMNRR